MKTIATSRQPAYVNPDAEFDDPESEAEVSSNDAVEGAWGKATANIDISADRCLAFFWHHMNYAGNANFEKDNGRLLKMQVDVPDSHSKFMVVSTKVPFPGVDNRVFSAKRAWRREENGVLVVGFTFKGTCIISPCPAAPPSLTLHRLQRACRASHQGGRAGRGVHTGGYPRILEVHAPRCERVPRNRRLPGDSRRKRPRPGHELVN
jgi:hypothetical protein